VKLIVTLPPALAPDRSARPARPEHTRRQARLQQALRRPQIRQLDSSDEFLYES